MKTLENLKILIFGSQGQLGKSLIHACKARGIQTLACDRSQGNLENPEEIFRLIVKERPGVVFNAAAYTQVDRAETERDLALTINAKSPQKMAQACVEVGAPLIHFSTDYVYSGTGERPWTEEDTIQPSNFYGHTKALGDQWITEAHECKFLIFRTSWVYHAEGKNFFQSMLKLGREKETLRIVCDQIGSPTYAPFLAQTALNSLEKALNLPQFPSGIYHASNSGFTSWAGFAEEIFAQAKKAGTPLQIQTLVRVPSSEYPTPAKRPLNSRFNLTKLEASFGIHPPDWKESLRDCFLDYSRLEKL